MLGSKERRRKRIRERPLSPDWRSILADSVLLYRRLPPEDRAALHGHVQVLLTEKHFEGAAGLVVSDRMKLVVAAQASVLLLHRTTAYYPKLVSILLYPGEYAVQEEVENEDGLIEEIDEARVGESWRTGTLILSWEDVERDLTIIPAVNTVIYQILRRELTAIDDRRVRKIGTSILVIARWPGVAA